MGIPIQDTKKQFAHAMIKDVSNGLWKVFEQYEHDDFYTTGEIRSMCQDFAQDLDKALQIIERK